MQPIIPEPKSAAWHEKRRGSIGGSDANILMSGDRQKIRKLWEIKTGISPPDSLDDVFRVQLGIVTEAFNAAWFEKITGFPVIARGDFRTKSLPGLKMACNLDGEVSLPDGTSAVLECKHTSAMSGLREAVANYQPQLHHNMIVTGHRRAYLSAILGNDWDYQQIDFNESFAATLITAETEFWECVTLKMPPSDTPEKHEMPEAHRVVDFEGNNAWAAAAADWIGNKAGAKAYDAAGDALRKLIAADVKIATGHGLRIARDKRNALRITAIKE